MEILYYDEIFDQSPFFIWHSSLKQHYNYFKSSWKTN